jgi:uncharacterized repeat protein (TIGR03803 family)
MRHDFNRGTDGYAPQGQVVFDKLGNMYGTTPHGGAYDQGALFMMIPAPTYGLKPCSTVSLAAAMERGPLRIWNGTTWENLYGATILGGSYGGGTLFKLSPSNGSWIPSRLSRFSLLTGAMP